MPQSKKKKTESRSNRSKKNKKQYKVRNWKEYNEALVNRGRILVQISMEALEKWEEEQKDKKKPGRPKKFSDLAIETALTFGQVFHLPLRTTEGVVSSILELMGTDKRSPDYTTLSIRGKDLSINMRTRPMRENLHIAVDSTGVKVFGEGEWKVRKHGYSKRRTWLEVHLGVDEETGDILVGEVTDNTVHDSEMVEPLLSQIPEEHPVSQFSGDGAYDTKNCYDALEARDIPKITIPPQKNARIWKHGNSKGKPHPRDENLREIREKGRRQWKIDNDYHRRSLSETAMFRLKTIFGDKVPARIFENQRNQLLLRLKMLNRMTLLGMPDSYVVE